MKTANLALVDCNNFFVSCERLFRPELEGRPVVVLSSNDGCVISRSNEAKALGVPMGAPVFKYRDLFKKQGVKQFSANFELYGDLSERITNLLTAGIPRIEVYSVDEAFLDLGALEISDYKAWGRLVRARILREVGLPVSIGLAPSKTLAKLASEHAKKDIFLGGVLDLISASDNLRNDYLMHTPINDVWDIGWRLAPKLKAEGILTAQDIAQMRPRLAGQLMGVHGRQLVAELNGQACHPLERFGSIRQTVMNGRMFGKDTSDFAAVEAAIAGLTARATYSLRKEGLLARKATLSLSTNRNKPNYQRQDSFDEFLTPTADTGYISSRLITLARAGFSASIQYHRANVLLYDLVKQSRVQPDLMGDIDLSLLQRSGQRLAAFDAINRRYGHNAIHFAAEDLSQVWQPKQQLRSPRYTTNWRELPIVRIL